MVNRILAKALLRRRTGKTKFSAPAEKEVMDMPYRMGHGGWFGWPPFAQWTGWHPGFPFPYWSPLGRPSRELEEAMLTEKAEFLEEELEQVRQRLKELRKSKKEKKDAE
jgi:hypothetical protein